MSSALASYIGRLQPMGSDAVPTGAAEGAVRASTFSAELRAAGLLWRTLALIVAHLLERGLLLIGWTFVGAGAINGRLDSGWLAACALALASSVPLHAIATWLQGVVSIEFGGLLKQRLLTAAMSINPDLLDSRGAGAMMSTVLESEAIDNLGATGGLAPVLALLELLLATPLLISGIAAGFELAVLAAFAVLLWYLIADNLRLRMHWTELRVALTDQLVDSMTAHRTRIVQRAPDEWHVDEDRDIEAYIAASQRLDRSTARIEAGLHRAYVIAAFAVLAPSFVLGGAGLTELAFSLGAILFAAGSLERFCLGYSRTAAAWTAWRILAPLSGGAADAGTDKRTAVTTPVPTRVLQAQDVGFKYPQRPDRVLNGCSLSVDRGDQLLLEGVSGSGKSTLAAVLAGARAPSDGFILAGGLDRHTLGQAAWRRRVALAPQYHENYLFTATLAFNLLLGRPGPHSQIDLDEAADVCRELGLGPLLARMPLGLHQFVGETGWRLSQGERSRIFLARALLQHADLVILDECLAALDPDNLEQCIECIMRRAPTVIVIAHR